MAVVLVLSLAACGGDAHEPTPSRSHETPGGGHTTRQSHGKVQRRPQSSPTGEFSRLLSGLLSRDRVKRGRAYQELKQTWPKYRPEVAALVKHRMVANRAAGAFLMSRLGSEKDLPVLRKFADDKSVVVRKQALPGLVRLRDRASAGRLKAMIASAKYDEMRTILAALCELAPKEGEAMCLELAKDGSWAKRRAAAQGLAKLTSDTSAAELTRLLDDPTYLVRADAIESVGMRRWKPARDKVLSFAGDDSYWVREQVARALGRFAVIDDVSTLAKLAVDDSEEVVRIAAVEALSNFPDDRVLPVLKWVVAKDIERRAKIKGKGKGKGGDRRSAILQVGEMSNEEARTYYLELLRSDDVPTRSDAVRIAKQRRWPWAVPALPKK